MPWAPVYARLKPTETEQLRGSVADTARASHLAERLGFFPDAVPARVDRLREAACGDLANRRGRPERTRWTEPCYVDCLGACPREWGRWVDPMAWRIGGEE